MRDLISIANTLKKRGPGVALTGAGISAESGIRTYRDPGGLWDTYSEGQSGGMLAVLAAHPEKAPEIIDAFFNSLEQARPNPGHLALVEMECMGLLSAVITQNVDDLHRAAGTQTLFELHGNVRRLRCTACGKKERPNRKIYFAGAREAVARLQDFNLKGLTDALPKCPACGGLVRPDFVGFGEAVQDLEPAIAAADSAGFVLIAGTSGVVYPAASLPVRAKRRGAFLVDINPEPGALTPHADVFLQGKAGDILPELVEAIKTTRQSRAQQAAE
jgi:NAD-dependent deacetylase